MLTRPEPPTRAPSPTPGALAPLPPEVVPCPSAAALIRIRDAGVNLALWPRPPRRAVRREAAGLLAHAPFSVTAEARAGCVGSVLAAALPAAAPSLAADIGALASAFAAIAGASRVHARLEALADAGCPVFHADHVGLRLLCTYAGPGTEWVPEPAVNRAGLRSGDNRRIVARRADVRRLSPFCVGLFKGEAFPGNAGRGIVHRSSPATARAPRLLLCLDEPGRF
jgi:hypothetical protein